jgi:hypothetical protein
MKLRVFACVRDGADAVAASRRSVANAALVIRSGCELRPQSCTVRVVVHQATPRSGLPWMPSITCPS